MILDSKKALSVLSTTVVIAVAISSIAGAWTVYKNHIWRPTVNVEGVDYSSGIAQLIVGGKKKTLFGNSTVWAGGDWGVRFGMGPDGKPNRIELVKSGMVHDTIIKIA